MSCNRQQFPAAMCSLMADITGEPVSQADWHGLVHLAKQQGYETGRSRRDMFELANGLRRLGDAEGHSDAAARAIKQAGFTEEKDGWSIEAVDGKYPSYTNNMAAVLRMLTNEGVTATLTTVRGTADSDNSDTPSGSTPTPRAVNLVDREAQQQAEQWKERDKTIDGLKENIAILQARLAEAEALDPAPKYHSFTINGLRKDIQTSEDKLADLHRRADAGIPDDAEDKSLAGNVYEGWFAKEKIVRNPDGTTNVWVRKSTDSGTEYLPVTGVEVMTDIHGKTGNALITSDGDKHIEWGYWENGHPVKHSVAITVAPPAKNARPLVEEGDPESAFHL